MSKIREILTPEEVMLYEKQKEEYMSGWVERDYSPEELEIFRGLLDKYNKDSSWRTEKGRLMFEVEVDKLLPSALVPWEEMY